MPYLDPEKERLRAISRRAYFREYRKSHPQPYVYKYKYHKGISKYKTESMAYKGEVLGLKVLVGSKRINRPCDLSWNGKLVDVKTAKPTLTNLGAVRWKFLLTTQKNKADLFLLIRKDEDDKTIDIHLVPNEGKKNISFNSQTVFKYRKYLLSL